VKQSAVRKSRFALLIAFALAFAVDALAADTRPVVTEDALARLAPEANPEALALALSAMQCAQAHGQGLNATRLTLIDYSKASLEPRLWVFDLARQRLLFAEYVAHGRHSGENFARSFSNLDGSLQTSLGLFLTGDTYQGGNGYSLRLQGLEQGTNDRAMARAIVIHGAPYVDPIAGKAQGRLGRSFGCPALRTAIATPLIDSIKHGNFVFSYFPDKDWLARSQLLQCKHEREVAAATHPATPAS
jgi:hypothetical protein